MSGRIQRDVAALWGGSVDCLWIHTPAVSFGSDRLCLIASLQQMGAFTMDGVSDRNAEGEDFHGLNGNLDFLAGMQGLQIVSISHQKGLTCIEALADISSLWQLDLHDTGVLRWPAVMSGLTSLKNITITQCPDPYIERAVYPRGRKRITLSDCFFNQPHLSTLALTFQSLVLYSTASFGNLKSLAELDLSGCDLLRFRNSNIVQVLQAGEKPLQGLTRLTKLSLSCFEPFSGAWRASKMDCLALVSAFQSSCP